MKKTLMMALALGVTSGVFAGNQSFDYPKTYKEWKHVKTMIIKPNHPMGKLFHGIHHIYANEMAYKGYQTGTFEDGAMIALDYLKYQDSNETITESDRIYVAFMKKDAKKYAETGGWGYEAFSPKEEKIVTDVNKMCVNCHLSQKDNSFVFSSLRK